MKLIKAPSLGSPSHTPSASGAVQARLCQAPFLFVHLTVFPTSVYKRD